MCVKNTWAVKPLAFLNYSLSIIYLNSKFKGFTSPGSSKTTRETNLRLTRNVELYILKARTFIIVGPVRQKVADGKGEGVVVWRITREGEMLASHAHCHLLK